MVEQVKLGCGKVRSGSVRKVGLLNEPPGTFLRVARGGKVKEPYLVSAALAGRRQPINASQARE
jgi:hypothetical protein